MFVLLLYDKLPYSIQIEDVDFTLGSIVQHCSQVHQIEEDESEHGEDKQEHFSTFSESKVTVYVCVHVPCFHVFLYDISNKVVV